MTPTNAPADRPSSQVAESAWQAAAEEQAVTHAGEHPAVAQYRLAYRAVQQAPMPPIPADFAAALERAVCPAQRVAGETLHWSASLATALLLVLLVATLALAWPMIAAPAGATLLQGPGRVLIAAAAALLLLSAGERWSLRGRGAGG